MSGRLEAGAPKRNSEPILQVLTRILPPVGLVLEVASGTGQHAAYLAPRLAPRRWQPSDLDRRRLESIAAWIDEATQKAGEAPVILPPILLDASADTWPIAHADAVININMIHIAPIEACQGLLAGAGRILPPGGPLYLYGPLMRGGSHTAPSNQAFDNSLRSQDPRWGVRDLDTVAAMADEYDLTLDETVEMPSNNLSVIFRKRL